MKKTMMKGVKAIGENVILVVILTLVGFLFLGENLSTNGMTLTFIDFILIDLFLGAIFWLVERCLKKRGQQLLLATLLIVQMSPVQAQKSRTSVPSLGQSARVPSSTVSYRLDSILTVLLDGTPVEKQVVEYNEGGQIGTLYELGYSYPADAAVPKGKHEYSYTDGGAMQKEDIYQYIGNEYLLTERMEVEKFYKGIDVPSVTVGSRLSDGVLQPFLKQVTTAVTRNRLDSYEVYLWQDGEWMYYAKGHFDYNIDGTTQQETVDMLMEGYTLTETIAYEYDSHQTVTQVTITLSVMGQVLQQVGIAYENSYDEHDCLVEQKTIPDDEEPTIDYYYWQDGTTTQVSALPRAFTSDGGFTDLSGRRRSTAPGRHGIYIAGGRKIAY